MESLGLNDDRGFWKIICTDGWARCLRDLGEMSSTSPIRTDPDSGRTSPTMQPCP